MSLEHTKYEVHSIDILELKATLYTILYLQHLRFNSDNLHNVKK